MISDEYKKVTVANIGGGVIDELFKRELQKVCENIDDINTNAKDTRIITIKVSIKPTEDRTTADVSVKATASLAGVKAHSSTIHLPKINGKNRQPFIHDVHQTEFNMDQVTPINGTGGDND